jgi:carbamoyltransferase
MAAILGISAFYHDSAAALLINGEIIAAAHEERFSRRKHDDRFPAAAVQFCLDTARIKPGDLDYVAFYEKPIVKFNRLLETYLAYEPAGLGQFLQAMPLWLKSKLHLPGVIRKELGGDYRRRIVFTSHHEAHAASAFFPSPYGEAAILTMDGVGGMAHGNNWSRQGQADRVAQGAEVSPFARAPLQRVHLLLRV